MSRRVASLRAHLLLLTLGTLLPMVLIGLGGAALIAQRERAIFERGATERTRAVLTAVDTELSGHANSLQLLARSVSLEAADLRTFYDEVRRLLPAQPNWARVDLADPAGDRVLDTEYAFTSAVPPVVDRASFEEALRRARPVVSSLFIDGGVYHFAVRVPVIREGHVRYLLSAIVEPRAILELLTRQRLPSDWVGVVVDDKRRIVARTMNPEGTFGHLASESLQAALDRSAEGWSHGYTLEGAEVYTPHNRSGFSGWTVAFGIPAAAVEAGASRAMSMLALGVLLATGLAMLLAMAISRSISSPIASLAATARALGRGAPVRPPDAGSVAEVHEVSRALMDAAAAVREREDALRAADRAKDDFLAMLGHELRNPLSALSSAAQILQREAGEEGPSSRAAAVIHRQVQHMTRLVDDLLDVARVTTGKVRLAPRPLNLAEVVAGAVQVLRSAGRLDAHDLRIEAAPVWIAADEARLEQIVSNLVGNAVKYTPPGGRIDVRVLRRGTEAVLEVNDTGVGLSPELAPRIFDLFVQGDQSIDRAAGGLGLGLTLVQRLAEMHGGRVGAESEGPGRGTRFTVTLPAIAPPVEADTTPPPPLPVGDGRRVLLVEDNDDAREVLRSALTLHGYEVFGSADGAAGLDTATAVDAEVAVVDIGLPGIDGYEVARRLRALPHGASLLLIAISGYGQPESRRRAFEAGFDEYVTKPVAPDVLAALIAAGLGRAEPGLAR